MPLAALRGSTRRSSVVFPTFRILAKKPCTMNKLLVVLVAGTFAATASAQGAAPAPAAATAPAVAQSAPAKADAAVKSETSRKADPGRKSAAKHKKKAKKSATHTAGLHVHAVNK